MLRSKRLLLAGLLAAALLEPVAALEYDVVYVRYPRHGDEEEVQLPDGESPYPIEPGADLVLLRRDGPEVVLVDCDETSSVLDPAVSFDGRWVYYVKYVGLVPGRAFYEQPGCAYLFKMRRRLGSRALRPLLDPGRRAGSGAPGRLQSRSGRPDGEQRFGQPPPSGLGHPPHRPRRRRSRPLPAGSGPGGRRPGVQRDVPWLRQWAAPGEVFAAMGRAG